MPEGRGVRPTASRAREALFDILGHAAFAERRAIDGARVLDAFAGTGALGLEALSRGAAHASFMERDRDARALLAANIAALGEDENARVLAADALHPPRAPAPCELIFMDPPYGEDVAAAALSALAQQDWIAGGAVIALELPAKHHFAIPGGFVLRDQRRYGRASILFVTPSA
ncbi:MAG TPA: 16S rRNA (guanine(966)-N(2))-methyltransferase RsmD [Stellaceae bacterium]|nr:16S rRNA (guanine(966)-N(2))-methyltransferase RsmD [Stellaceae bacterium]